MPFDSLPQEKPAPVSDVDQVLGRMIELIDAGWCQGTMHQFDAREGKMTEHLYCMIGALRVSVTEYAATVETPVPFFNLGVAVAREWTQFRMFDRALERLGMDRHEVERWNDEPSRTKAQVIERLREARERAHAV